MSIAQCSLTGQSKKRSQRTLAKQLTMVTAGRLSKSLNHHFMRLSWGWRKNLSFLLIEAIESNLKSLFFWNSNFKPSISMKANFQLLGHLVLAILFAFSLKEGSFDCSYNHCRCQHKMLNEHYSLPIIWRLPWVRQVKRVWIRFPLL